MPNTPTTSLTETQVAQASLQNPGLAAFYGEQARQALQTIQCHIAYRVQLALAFQKEN